MQVRLKDGTRVISLLLIILSGVFYYITYSFPKEKGPVASEYGSAFFPRFLLGFIIVVSVILFLQATFRKLKPLSEEMVSLGREALFRSLAVWAVCMLFYWGWYFWGYLAASPVFMVLLGLLLGVRKILALLFLACMSPLMYVVFENLLHVGL